MSQVSQLLEHGWPLCGLGLGVGGGGGLLRYHVLRFTGPRFTVFLVFLGFSIIAI